MSQSKLAIVTGGAGGGIGHGVSTALARVGWDVLIVELSEVAADTLAGELSAQGHSVRTLIADLRADDTPERIVNEALAWKGRIDGVVNNAGIGLTKSVPEISDDDFDGLMAVNLRATFRLSRQVLPELTKTRGSIVNIGSVHGRSPMPKFSVYAASKAAVEGLTRGMAVDFGLHGVRINCVAPGMVDGPQTRQVLANLGMDADSYLQDWIQTRQLLPWLVSPLDVGKLVAFLLGDDARAITGQSVVIDAGTLTMLVDGEASR